jgi:signal transduction histidine kinase
MSKLQPRQRFLLLLAVFFFLVHIAIAIFAKPSYALTMVGDATPCVLLIIAIFAARENFRVQHGLLPVFWKLMAAGLFQMLLSQAFWFYYDTLRQYSSPSPVIGDTLFLLAHVFFLSAFALRPHSASAGHDLRLRNLDFALLTLWWLTLYGYVALPWQVVVPDFSKYDPAYYLLALIQHLMIITALALLAKANNGMWRAFYAGFIAVFVAIAAANLLLSIAIDKGWYYAGSFFDTPFLFSLLLFTAIACFGPILQPVVDTARNREVQQGLWTARLAMVAILSLPLIALFGAFQKNVPAAVSTFRFRLVFGALLLLSTLVFRKLTLLTRELSQHVRLSQASLENLKSVQAQVAHAEKLTALGRLASGATHEISNPLTAILGYSELLADVPSLSPPDRESAEIIQQQVHRAQAAVNSLRNTIRTTGPAQMTRIDPSTNS